mmetsp:Transcript_61568/g.132419  ORF Transcript_61568/g.132419 Transcript_61568/m.132419 type:complete len:863 (+) Transcript_61568:112-2700(+)
MTDIIADDVSSEINTVKKVFGDKKTHDGHSDMIRSPIVRCVFSGIVNMPCSCLIVLVVMFFVSSHFGGKPYHLAKSKAEDSGEGADLLRDALKDDVTDALMYNFAHNVMIPPQLTNVVMWVEAGKQIRDFDGFKQLQDDVLSAVKEASTDPICLPQLPMMGLVQLSPDGSALRLPITKGQLGQSSAQCESVIRNKLIEFQGRVEGVSVSVGSALAATNASLKGALDTLTHHMRILGPVMFWLLFLILGSIPRAITPFITICVSNQFANFVVYIIRLAWPHFNIGGPDQIVAFILLALGIDYALFFWTRFSQERKKHPEKEAYNAAIITTLETSGCVIFVSVLALTVVYIGLSFYPHMNACGDLKNHIQLIAGITMLGIASLAWPAALAAQFPSMFDEPAGNEVYCCSIKCEAFGNCLNAISPLSFYFNRCSAWVTRTPFKFVAPFLVLAGFVPFLVVLSERKVNYDMANGVMSPSTLEYQAFSITKDRFAGSKMAPVPVLLEAMPIGKSPVLSALSLDATSMLQVLLGHGNIQASEMTDTSSVAFSPGFGSMACKFAKTVLQKTRGTDHEIRPVDLDGLWWNADKGECVDAHSTPKPSLMHPSSKDGLMQVMFLYPHYTQMGTESQHLTRTMWNEVEPAAEGTFDVDGQRYNFRVRHASKISSMMRMEKACKKAAPIVLPITALAVCGLFGFMFNSVGITIKVMLTVILPLCGSYGITVGAFQYGWFECFGVMRIEEGLFWTLFYNAMCFLFALAVDYDMFLFARVYEYRHMGYDNDSAVVMGLKETGPVITTAGTIMMLSFFTLCMTDQFMIQQLAFLYFIGVAVDTYIVRIFVAPAALCLSETMNYWPGKVPEVTKKLMD